jgi:hypothetical protein
MKALMFSKFFLVTKFVPLSHVPLSLVSTTEELLERKVAATV